RIQNNGGPYGLTKTGAGQLLLNSTTGNAYPGPTVVNGGTLFMDNVVANVFNPTAIVNSGGTLGGGGDVGALTNNADGVVMPAFAAVTPRILLAKTGATLQASSTLRIMIHGTTLGSDYSQLSVAGGPVVLNNPPLELAQTFTPPNGTLF